VIKYPEEIRQDWWEYILRKYIYAIQEQEAENMDEDQQAWDVQEVEEEVWEQGKEGEVQV